MNNTKIAALKPNALWKYFCDLNSIPRASKKEEKVIDFMISFGISIGLKTIRDEIGNIIIKKPATQGMENHRTVVLQSHLDMVHQKNDSIVFDFDTQGIQMNIDGDWVKANGTTLGADNGIGVATMMAILASKDIAHPNIEALFTIDEETGMTGAQNLNPNILNGSILLNLDSEKDTELTIGCAGGVDFTAVGSYEYQKIIQEYQCYIIKITGLRGGHSGMDIHKGRANAIKLIVRLLSELLGKKYTKISMIKGGSLRNAIPREASAIVYCKTNPKDFFNDIQNTIIDEYQHSDPDIKISIDKHQYTNTSLTEKDANTLLTILSNTPNGIYRMSPTIDNLVQTSNNLAKIVVENGNYEILCLVRSSVESEKMQLCNSIASLFNLLGAHTSADGSYPGWQPNPDSSINVILKNSYYSLFGIKPEIVACHAGLECGIIGRHYPKMEMISFGPNIVGAHSPDERVQISSVQKFWEFLVTILKNIPKIK